MRKMDTIMHANVLKRLDWDSEFLGYGVARLRAVRLQLDELHGLATSARLAGLRLIYLVAEPGDQLSNASASQAGAWLADRKVTFWMPVPPETAYEPLSQLIRSTTGLTATLESLALQSGEYSRFRLDSKFEPTIFARLYGEWLRKSLAHELAREVLVYESAGKTLPDHAEALGLLTLGVKRRRTDIGLLAVDEQARGQRIGQQLVQAAKQRTAVWGLRELQVVTQLNNERACRFYRHCGFQEDTVEHVYHLWL